MKVDTKVTIKLTEEEKNFFCEMSNFIEKIWDEFSEQVTNSDVSDVTETFAHAMLAIDSEIDNVLTCIDDEVDDDE
jgi:DNA replication initiation complex subunit (GINS family)